MILCFIHLFPAYLHYKMVEETNNECYSYSHPQQEESPLNILQFERLH